jgi:hypothetical protein
MSEKQTGAARPQTSTSCTLRDACRTAGYDEGGRRCAICPVKDLCENDDRWLVTLTEPSGGSPPSAR